MNAREAVLRWIAVAALVLVAGTARAADASSPGALSRDVTAAMARERRVALVIGNAHYASSPLANPVNDARAIAGALKAMAFRVTIIEDATIGQMADAVRKFGDSLQPGGVGLFFYAGHGMQIKGRNYLIPVGASIQREDEVAFNAFDAGQVLEKMEAARSGINIVILDACRDNPFTRSFRSSARGLAIMEAPSGSYVAMATAPGRVASDGDDGNGLYTKHLLAAMRTPGIPIEDVFKRTRVKVMAATRNQQVPWDYSSLSGNFYFVPGQGADAAMASADTPRKEHDPQSGAPAKRRPSTAASAAEDQRASASRPVDSMQLAKALPSLMEPPATPQPDRAALEALYRKGIDAKVSDPATASESFGRAADGGHAAAAYELGLLLKIGRKPLHQDLPRAVKQFVQAAEQGHPLAQYEAAQAYAQGIGAAKSCKEALGWAQKSAHNGSIEGALLAGDLNKADCGGSRNFSESARWYRIAADRGLAPAQFALGVLYMNGEGVTRDVAEARKWLTAAVAQGNTSAKFYLERLPR